MQSEAITRGIKIQVRARYVPEQSSARHGRFLWAYQVTITNESDEVVQLISRHWIIRDAFGRSENVRGPGVVGEQPVIPPGQAFTYTSACPLPTHTGNMQGTYQMVAESGESFDAVVARFELYLPHEMN